MAHKIITFLTALTLFTTTIPMNQSNATTNKDQKDEQMIESSKSREETNFQLITNALYDCGQTIKKLEKNIDIVDNKVNKHDSTVQNYIQMIEKLEKEIKIAQNDIKCLQNLSKNNSQQVKTLEELKNHMTNSFQKLTQDMQNLNSNISKNYVTKEEASSCQKQINSLLNDVKKKFTLFLEKKPRSTSPYKQYLLKIALPVALVACIAILYKVRKPLQKKMHATLKKIRSFFSRKKIIDLF